MFQLHIPTHVLNISIQNVSYAFYPTKNRYLPDFMYSYDCQTYWGPNIHTATMTYSAVDLRMT